MDHNVRIISQIELLIEFTNREKVQANEEEELKSIKIYFLDFEISFSLILRHKTK